MQYVNINRFVLQEYSILPWRVMMVNKCILKLSIFIDSSELEFGSTLFFIGRKIKIIVDSL